MAGAFPDRAILESVLDTATRAPSVKNLQPWRWQVDRSGVHLHADWSRQDGSALFDRRDVLLGCGTVLDHCVVAFAAAGWHPRVHRFPDPEDRGHLALIELVEQPPRPLHRELADAILRRRADRRTYSRQRVPAGTLELLHIRAARLGVELGVVPRRRWQRLDDGDVTLRYGEAASGGAAADDAAMLVLGTSRDDDRAWLGVGEALSHILLSAAAMDLATCPLTKPLAGNRSRLALACEVFDAAAVPQALIRLGVPPDGPVPPLVARRPVSENTEWIASETGHTPTR